MKSLTGPVIKSLVFIVITVFATTVLALTIVNGGSSGGPTYHARFTDVTSLSAGDDVRMAGVRVGQVTSVSVSHHRQARVGFTVQSDLRLARTVTATIRYRNLIGQRYLSLDEGDGSLDNALPAGSTIPLSRTTPALDLTQLFDGFQPLFQALSPKQVNALSSEVIQVFQGEGPTIDNLLQQTAQLTSTVASKDAVIGSVIDNLNSVLSVVNAHGNRLGTLVSTLQRFVSGLAADRGPLGRAITGLSGLTTDVSGLLQQGRAPLKASIDNLGALSANLAGSSGALNSFLATLPGKLTKIGRIASYGSWLNFYLCSVGGRIPVPSGYGNVTINPRTRARSAPNPEGLVGVQPVAARCA